MTDLIEAMRAEFRQSLPAILDGHDPILNLRDTLDGYTNLLTTSYAGSKSPEFVSNFSAVPSIATIKQVVADLASVPMHSMAQDCRSQRFVIPRWAAMYIAHEIYAYPGSLVARRFNRDPSSMFHAYREVKRRLPTDGELHSLIGRAVEKLKS